MCHHIKIISSKDKRVLLPFGSCLFFSSSTILALSALLRCSLCLCGSTTTWTTPGPLVTFSAWYAFIWSMSTCTPPSTSWCVSACVAVSSSCVRWGATLPREKETWLSVPLVGCWSSWAVCPSLWWGPPAMTWTLTPERKTPPSVSQSCPWGLSVVQQPGSSWSQPSCWASSSPSSWC